MNTGIERKNTVIEKVGADWAILFIFLAAFLIRAIYIFQVLKFPLTEYLASSNTFDQCQFDQNALKIISGNGIGKDVFGKEPLYSYFLAVIYTIFGHNHLIVYIIQAIITSLGVVLIYKTTVEIFNKTTGVVAGLIFLFYSISVYYDAILLRESLITFLNILLFYLILKALGKDKPVKWLMAGVILGLLTLMRHNLFLPFILMFVLWRERPFKRSLRYALVFCAGIFIVVLPVVARNYIVSDYKYVGISREVNAFWVGNNPASSGVDVDWSDQYSYLNNKSGGSIRKTVAVFLEQVSRRPGIYAKLYMRKIWMFFNGYEAPSNTNYYLYREEFPTILRWPLVNFRFVAAFGIIGIFLAFLRKEKPYLLLIFFAVLAGSVILFHIQSRFRLPSSPFLIIFSSYSIYYILSKIRSRHFLKCAAVTALGIVFYIALKPDLTYAGYRKVKDAIRPIDRTNLALSYISAYRGPKDSDLLRRALKHCDLALKEEPDSYVPYSIKGQIYYLEGRLMDSIAEYKRAIIYDNRNPFLYNELAGVYYTQGSYHAAALYIKRGLRLFPGNKVFEKNLSMIPI